MTRLLLAAVPLLTVGCALQTPAGADGETAHTRSATPAGTTSTTSSAMGKAHPWPMRTASRSRASSPVHERTLTVSRSRRTADPHGTGSPTLNWAALRECENSGQYTSKPTDHYRGAYQFDYQTWRSVGGTGDPAAASPAEQDYRARLLYQARGRQPWPACGRRL
jgi:hypothetical protein